jgi:hypothetical protein
MENRNLAEKFGGGIPASGILRFPTHPKTARSQITINARHFIQFANFASLKRNDHG